MDYRLLENPLYYSYDEQLLPVPLRERIGSRFDLVLSNPLEPTHTLPSGTPLVQVFEQAGGELLILGEPGAGITTLLLELARDLLKRAKDNPAALIPVVFMLSSWATRKQPLEQWITEELKVKYDVPSPIGQAWVKANQLVLLLDGLDEVAPSALPACIDAINAYYHLGHRSLVVCSRMKEFLDQPGRLALPTAVIAQPLSFEQVDTYLDGLAAKGEEVDGLKQALHQSEALRTLAATPLFLTVLILAYHGKPMQELVALVKAAPADQQHQLFHNYVERALQRQGKRIHASTQQTRYSLAWLARQMTAHQQNELYLEQFQPDWLPNRHRAFYRLSFDLFSGLLFALVIGLVLGLHFGQRGGLGAGLFIGLIYGLRDGLGAGLLTGLGAGLLTGLASGFGVIPESSQEQLTERTMLPINEGIRRSIINGLVGGLIGGLIGELLVRRIIGLPFGISGLLFGVFFGWFLGWGPTIQHYTIRYWLWRGRCTPPPWRYVAFLDDVVEQQLLRKVGGGYIFRHRLLQDYFASLEGVPPHDPSVPAEARSVSPNAANSDPSVS